MEKKKNEIQIKEDALIILPCFIQIAEDLMVEVHNCEGIKGNFNYERIQIMNGLNTLRKRVNRSLTKDEQSYFYDVVCNIVDNCEDELKYIKTIIKSNYVQQIEYSQIDPATLLLMVKTCFAFIQKLNYQLTNKHLSGITTAQTYLNDLINNFVWHKLKNNIQLDESEIITAWVTLYNKMQKQVNKIKTK